MDISGMMGEIRQHPDFHKAGMMLVHNGVVRGTSREGQRVRGLRVAVDHEHLGRILEEQKMRTGIIDIRVEIAENRDLAVGEDVMVLIVAGDMRARNRRPQRYPESHQGHRDRENGVLSFLIGQLSHLPARKLARGPGVRSILLAPLSSSGCQLSGGRCLR